MTASKFSVTWILLNFVFFIVRGDTDTLCQFGQSCMLLCTFQPGDDAVIHWLQIIPGKPDIQVHSYYYGEDHLELQDKRFKGRTLLFNNQISRGNASLKLSRITLQDEGRYKCYTSTIIGNKESFISLKVYAPVQTATIEKINNIITCRSDGIYPEPDLTWEPSPSSLPETKKYRTEEGLYTISSSVRLSDTDLDYSCTVSTSSSKKRVTLFKQNEVNSSDSEVTINCGALSSSQKSLTWRFNKTQLILTIRTPEDPYKVSEEWKKYVKSVSATGSLTLQDLSSKQDGVYTCELSDTEEMFLNHTALHYTESDEHKTVIIAALAGIIGIIVLVIVIIVLWRKKQEKKGKAQKTTENPEEKDGLNKGAP